MAYQVLARKWRPQRFSEVVGQEHITRTLQNAILQSRVGHAYLFVGPRGIGKTTTARIFAKALNCLQGIVPEPCGECTNCREIAQGASLDVIEIDGASHNKVEHVRDIRDNVQYTPAHSRFKIYLIDEVHMLTPAAWNALLKTLEEPPPHVKFLFATTEAHKVLPTIVSRCQRFDFKGIPVPLIVACLRQIAVQEGIHVDEGALSAIARAADGGMRDAQSIFDQIIAFCGGLAEAERIREQDVIEVFGLASAGELRTLTVGLLSNDLNAAIEVIQNLADRGRDLERLFADLVAYVRNLMVCTVCRDPGRILELTESDLQETLALARSVDPALIQRLVQGLVAEEWSFRSALNKRLYLEATLARVMLEAHSVQLNDIIAQLLALQAAGQLPALPAPVRRQAWTEAART
jgi:DNA polymerase-3 subunit gamma/tau